VAAIDLNCDLGEAFGAWTMGEDESLLRVVSSASIACGFHAGDPSTMRRTCAAAGESGVAIGAHVGYRDLAGFGRRPMRVPGQELTDEIVYQIAALDGFARPAGSPVRYVKPHGALYNTVAVDRDQAVALAEALLRYDSDLVLVGLAGSEGLRIAADRGLRVVAEAFADRAYTPQGTLVSRLEPGAVLHDPELIIERCLRMVREGLVEAVDGSVVEFSAQTVCVHGDTPGAVEIARGLREGLTEAGVQIRAFAAPRNP
jgi:5-oxoprolinase (ATP-hydrolysing) subunit A